MNIELKKRLALAKVDLVKFRDILTKTFNLEKAIHKSTTVVDTKHTIDKSHIINLVYTAQDWGEIIDCMTLKQKSMYVAVLEIHCEDWVQYKPGELTQGKISLEKSCFDGETIMLVNSLIKNYGHHVKTLLRAQGFMYGDKEFKKVFEGVI